MKLPFDKVYCLHLAESTDRFENIKYQFNKMGIDNQVEIWWTTQRKISDFIGNSIKTLRTYHYDGIYNTSKPNIYANVFNCSIEFYTMIKQAYLRGFETLLVMEDDISFYDDFDYESLFNNLPDDWDILRLGYSDYHNQWIKNEPIYKECPDAILRANWQFGGMCLTAFNRKAMQYYINYMDAKFECADAPLLYCFNSDNKKYIPDNDNLKVYIARQSIVKVNNFRSTIQS